MKKVYGEIYSEDAFRGVSVPCELRYVLEHLMNEENDLIIDIFDSYEAYKEEEVQMSHYAKDGSDGTEEIETVEEFKKWFRKEFKHEIEDDRISEKTLKLIDGLKELPPSKVLSDDDAILILEDVIDTLIEVGNGTTDEQLHEAADKLLNFRDNWLHKVL
jgi:hypothetical protein